MFLVPRRKFFKFLISGLVSLGLWPNMACNNSNQNKHGAIQKKFSDKISRIIRNEDRPDFNVRSFKPISPINKNQWSLFAGGLTKEPRTFYFDDIVSLKSETQLSRLKCVECWSAKAKWEGVSIKTLFEIVKPMEQARWVYFRSVDGYYETIPLKDLLNPRVLLVYKMNDKLLPPEHGAPLRLIIPFKYGYKNVKYITRMEFLDKDKSGYWPDEGSYSLDGSIQPGYDHPLDKGKKRIFINGGEVFHDFDKLG